MKKILKRNKYLRINTPASFGILCAAIIILFGGLTYALAAGVIAPSVKASTQAEMAQATIDPAAVVTPEAETTPDVENIEGNVVTTKDPVTGEMILVEQPEVTVTPEPEQPLKGVTVAIDAAKSKEGKHKGVASGTYEYVINMAFAQAVETKLKELGAEVVMTRTSNDEVPSGSERVKKINDSNASLLVSICCNDITSSLTRGAEAFVAKKASEESQVLAQVILNNYVEETEMPLRYETGDSVRPVEDRVVLSDSNMPAMGLVLGQLSNKSDDANLNDTAFIQKAAEGIVKGIREYLGK